MRITWIGHSCFRLESFGFTIVLDPYQDSYVPGLSPVRENAHRVLCSHNHNDHNAADIIHTLPCNIPDPFDIHFIEYYHDEEQGKIRGMSKITIISDSQYRIAHLGDLGEIPNQSVLGQLNKLDAILIPVGGYYTIDAEKASLIVDMLKPRVVLPMHYRSRELGFGFDEISELSAFTSLRGSVEYSDTDSLILGVSYRAETIILKPQNIIPKGAAS